MIRMGLSLEDRMAQLPKTVRDAWVADQPTSLVTDMARGAWWWVARPEQVPPPGNWLVCLALAGRGFGKLTDANTPIAAAPGRQGGTEFTWMRLGDLLPGDRVFDEHGEPCAVQAVYDQTPEIAYRVHFSDQTYIDACSEHQWVTWTHLDRRQYRRHGGRDLPTNWATANRIKTTQQIFETQTYGNRGDRSHCIPVAAPINLPSVNLLLDPWQLGYWLGNGASKTGQITAHLADGEFVSGMFGGVDIRPVSDGRSAVNLYPKITALLRQLGVLNNKHVPHQYLWNDINSRRRLLAGLLDSDGHIHAVSGHVEFCSTDKPLADAVMFLVRSLGQKPVIAESRAKLNGVDHGPKWRVTWRPTENPFLSPRKRAGYREPDAQRSRNQQRMITKVERVDPIPMRCITVDSPNSMYLLGEALIPTHNSRAGSEWIVDRCLQHPYDASGTPTERLVIAETLSDARTICMEGPAGVLRALDRRQVKYRYKMSPRPMVLFPNGAKIYTEGADSPDVGRGYNASDAWLDEICIAAGELIRTQRGPVPVENVTTEDQVLTRKGYRPVSWAGLSKEAVATVRVMTAAGTARVTPDHRVFTLGAGWIRADHLTPGAAVCALNAPRPEPWTTEVLAVVAADEPIDVYDITVEGDAPEFFAGTGEILVHNCKWRSPRQSWYEGIMPSLRADLIGDHPRAFVTTTPKPMDLLQEWVKRDDGSVHIIRGSTFDNAKNLSTLVMAELLKRYEGTTIGLQELYGEILEALDGALFTRLDIANSRVGEAPYLVSTVVGVDPALTGEDDEMGVVVVGRDVDNHMYVLEDASVLAVGRAAALHAWRVFARWGADVLLYEANLGKGWMEQVFRDAYFELVGTGLFPAGSSPPCKPVDARRGKKTRAEPVAMRMEQQKLHVVGHMPDLEDQMATFVSWDTKESPDRLDAMVHACRHLMAGERKQSRLASPVNLSSTLSQLWRDTDTW